MRRWAGPVVGGVAARRGSTAVVAVWVRAGRGGAPGYDPQACGGCRTLVWALLSSQPGRPGLQVMRVIMVQ
jgi:hypothetical protein